MGSEYKSVSKVCRWKSLTTCVPVFKVKWACLLHNIQHLFFSFPVFVLVYFPWCWSFCSFLYSNQARSMPIRCRWRQGLFRHCKNVKINDPFNQKRGILFGYHSNADKKKLMSNEVRSEQEKTYMSSMWKLFLVYNIEDRQFWTIKNYLIIKGKLELMKSLVI